MTEKHHFGKEPVWVRAPGWVTVASIPKKENQDIRIRVRQVNRRCRVDVRLFETPEGEQTRVPHAWGLTISTGILDEIIAGLMRAKEEAERFGRLRRSGKRGAA